MITHAQRMWIAAGTVAAIHQSEELAFSMRSWLNEQETTTFPWLDRHIQTAPLAAESLTPRAATVALQAAGLLTVATLSSKSVRLSRLLTSALTLGFTGAFTGHLIVAWKTRSIAPGTITSIIPGIPDALLALRIIHHEGSKQ